jgi:hypothetical protein
MYEIHDFIYATQTTPSIDLEGKRYDFYSDQRGGGKAGLQSRLGLTKRSFQIRLDFNSTELFRVERAETKEPLIGLVKLVR